MNKDVIIACDFPSAERTLEFLDLFKEVKPFVKIGMELFYSAGPDIVRAVKARGHKVFLDLKVHDIPNTASRAMAALAALDVDMTNVHAAGSIKMMQYAAEGLTKGGKRPLLIAVTQLTSTSEQVMRDELLINVSMPETVAHYAMNAAKAGLDGVVCSPLESPDVHRACGKAFLTVTPGVRFSDGEAGDQTRITTPAQAAAFGSDFIVVGRPITAAPDPVAAYNRCLAEFLG